MRDVLQQLSGIRKLREYAFHIMSIPGLPPVQATVVFRQNKPQTILSTPPLADPTYVRNRLLRLLYRRWTRAGHFGLPGMCVHQVFQGNAESVFVVETGPLGFVVDHPITNNEQS